MKIYFKRREKVMKIKPLGKTTGEQIGVPWM